MKIKTFEKLSLLVYAIFFYLPPILIFLLILSFIFPEAYHIARIIIFFIVAVFIILLFIFWVSPVEPNGAQNK